MTQTCTPRDSPGCDVTHYDRVEMAEAHWVFAVTYQNDMAFIEYYQPGFHSSSGCLVGSLYSPPNKRGGFT